MRKHMHSQRGKEKWRLHDVARKKRKRVIKVTSER